MRRLIKIVLTLNIGLLFAGVSHLVLAEEQVTDEDLSLIYGDKSSISVATGTTQSLRRAPAVATVITAEDIEATGATTLDDILETVPGMHVGRSTVLNMAIYTIRGVRNGISNPQVLVLLNGVPIMSAYNGDRGFGWGGMPLKDVARIEVMRGPGSALYGANAFSSVINVITKTAAQQDGTSLGLRIGSFQSRDAWVLHGGKLGDVNVAASLQYSSTAGANPLVERDAQSGYDALFGTHASLAPGRENFSRAATDASLDFSYEKWDMHLSFMHRENLGAGTGIAMALDPKGWGSSQRFIADLKYINPDFSKDWGLELNGNFTYWNENSMVVIFPPGAFGGAFKDGFIGSPGRSERQTRMEAKLLYRGFAQHQLRFGAGASKEELYKVRETKNFNPDNSPINVGAFSDMQDVTDTVPYIRPHSRIVRYLYAQDEWQFAKDWALTAGVRGDQYSDFGKTVNPRLALVWDVDYNLTAKLLYGTAFRAPSFSELYVINNPIINGNPNLKPEKMRMSEAALLWQARPNLQLGLNIFQYKISDMVQESNNFLYINVGDRTGRGFEMEAKWDINKDWSLAGNYAYQRAVDGVTQQDPGLTPRRHAYLRADWQAPSEMRVNLQVNHVADRLRELNDTRPQVKDYTTLDLTIGSKRKNSGWDWALSVRNMFNADVREPSVFSTPFINMPNDIPMGGRSMFLQISHKL